ncbi:MAG: PadR family transcriptional regulator [Desulfurococcales archaeon]|nr:PadR family transcriptional regulator [Desulfurococcales archaeon]
MSEEKALRKFMREVRTGLYGVLIMHALRVKGEMHGYGLRQVIEEMTSGELRPVESTVYETLKKLSKVGILKSEWRVGGPALPRKYYSLTEVGVKVYESLRPEVVKLLSAVLKVLEG